MPPLVPAYAPGKRVSPAVTAFESAVLSAVLYASLFDFPLTLSELRATLTVRVGSIDDLRRQIVGSLVLRRHLTVVGDWVLPAGRTDLIPIRERRTRRSRAFLFAHQRILRLLCTVPFTRMVAISGSLAWLNADDDADLDLFVVAADRHVWTVTVLMILAARLLRCRERVCVNFVVAESAIALDEHDRFSASQLRGLRPVEGHEWFRGLMVANPSVARWFPNEEPAGPFPSLEGAFPRVRHLAERSLGFGGHVLEWLCRRLYHWHLMRRRTGWDSPNQVRLDDDVLKLHTRSHRERVMAQHAALLSSIGSGR